MQFGEYPKHFIIGKTKLYLGLVSGEKLRDIQSFGTQDPYCEVYISKRRQPSSQDLVYKSKTHDNGGASPPYGHSIQPRAQLTLPGGLRSTCRSVGKNPRWMEALTVGVRCIEHDFLTIRVMNDNNLKEYVCAIDIAHAWPRSHVR